MRFVRGRAEAVLFAIGVAWAWPAAGQISFQRTFIRNVPLDAFSATPQAIALADLTGDARDDIIVVAAEEDQIAVYRNNGSGGFPGTPATFGTGAGPVAVVTADFNGDGLLDVATANNDAGTITVQLGDGTGNFNSPRDFDVDDAPVGLVAVDLNNNGMPDLAVLSSETVHLLRSNGDGTFSNFDPASVEILCADGVAIAAGLFDANTNQDLAVSCDIAGQVSVLLGNGNGTFQAAQLFSAGAGPAGLVVAPLFQANIRDIAVVQEANFGDENITLLIGNGQGSFSFETTTAGLDSTAITAADFNLDGRIDLAVTNTGETQSVAILLNDPTSTDNGFRYLPNVPGTSLGTDAGAFAVQRGNINGDGLPDLIALGEDQNGPLIGVLINTSSQTPSPTTPAVTPGTPTPTPLDTPTATPIGPTSTFTATNTFTPTATPTPIPTVPYTLCNTNQPGQPRIGGQPVASATGRLLNETPFIAVVDNQGGRLVVLTANINRSASTACELLGLRQGIILSGINGPRAIMSQTVDLTGASLPLDLDRDGRTDLAVVGSDGLSLFFGDGMGGFAPSAGNPFGTGTNPTSIGSTDFNRDGLPDIIVANGGSNSLSVFLGTGGRSLEPACPALVGRPTNVVVAQDLNGDGRPDFAAGSDATNDVSVLLQVTPTATPTGSPAGTPVPTPGCAPITTGFRGLTPLDLPAPPAAMTVNIFEATDRVPDLAVALAPLLAGGSVQVFLGRSMGTNVVYQLGSRVSLPQPTSGPRSLTRPSALGSADVNDDGLQDLIVTDVNNGTLVIFLAQQDGSFNQALIPQRVDPAMGTGTPPRPMGLGVAFQPDIDGDGKPDLVVANSGDGSITVFVSAIQPATPTPQPTATPTHSATATVTPTVTPEPTATQTESGSATPTFTPLPTNSRTPSVTPTSTYKAGTFALSGCSIRRERETATGRDGWWLLVGLLLLVARRRSQVARSGEGR